MDVNDLVKQINDLAGSEIFRFRAVKTIAEAKMYGGRNGMVPYSVAHPNLKYSSMDLAIFLEGMKSDIIYTEQKAADTANTAELEIIMNKIRSVLTEREINMLMVSMQPQAFA